MTMWIPMSLVKSWSLFKPWLFGAWKLCSDCWVSCSASATREDVFFLGGEIAPLQGLENCTMARLDSDWNLLTWNGIAVAGKAPLKAWVWGGGAFAKREGGTFWYLVSLKHHPINCKAPFSISRSHFDGHKICGVLWVGFLGQGEEVEDLP